MDHQLDEKNSLTLLNNALATGGFTLEVSKNYKLTKPLVIYNYFSKNLKESIINNKNSIILNADSTINLCSTNPITLTADSDGTADYFIWSTSSTFSPASFVFCS